MADDKTQDAPATSASQDQSQASASSETLPEVQTQDTAGIRTQVTTTEDQPEVTTSSEDRTDNATSQVQTQALEETPTSIVSDLNPPATTEPDLTVQGSNPEKQVQVEAATYVNPSETVSDNETGKETEGTLEKTIAEDIPISPTKDNDNTEALQDNTTSETLTPDTNIQTELNITVNPELLDGSSSVNNQAETSGTDTDISINKPQIPDSTPEVSPTDTDNTRSENETLCVPQKNAQATVDVKHIDGSEPNILISEQTQGSPVKVANTQQEEKVTDVVDPVEKSDEEKVTIEDAEQFEQFKSTVHEPNMGTDEQAMNTEENATNEEAMNTEENIPDTAANDMDTAQTASTEVETMDTEENIVDNVVDEKSEDNITLTVLQNVGDNADKDSSDINIDQSKTISAKAEDGDNVSQGESDNLTEETVKIDNVKGAGEVDNVVEETVESDNVVEMDDGENVVKGTGEGDNVVEGTGESDNVAEIAGVSDNVAQGNCESDNVAEITGVGDNVAQGTGDDNKVAEETSEHSHFVKSDVVEAKSDNITEALTVAQDIDTEKKTGADILTTLPTKSNEETINKQDVVAKETDTVELEAQTTEESLPSTEISEKDSTEASTQDQEVANPDIVATLSSQTTTDTEQTTKETNPPSITEIESDVKTTEPVEASTSPTHILSEIPDASVEPAKDLIEPSTSISGEQEAETPILPEDVALAPGEQQADHANPPEERVEVILGGLDQQASQEEPTADATPSQVVEFQPMSTEEQHPDAPVQQSPSEEQEKEVSIVERSSVSVEEETGTNESNAQLPVLNVPIMDSSEKSQANDAQMSSSNEETTTHEEDTKLQSHVAEEPAVAGNENDTERQQAEVTDAIITTKPTEAPLDLTPDASAKDEALALTTNDNTEAAEEAKVDNDCPEAMDTSEQVAPEESQGFNVVQAEERSSDIEAVKVTDSGPTHGQEAHTTDILPVNLATEKRAEETMETSAAAPIQEPRESEPVLDLSMGESTTKSSTGLNEDKNEENIDEVIDLSNLSNENSGLLVIDEGPDTEDRETNIQESQSDLSTPLKDTNCQPTEEGPVNLAVYKESSSVENSLSSQPSEVQEKQSFSTAQTSVSGDLGAIPPVLPSNSVSTSVIVKTPSASNASVSSASSLATSSSSAATAISIASSTSTPSSTSSTPDTTLKVNSVEVSHDLQSSMEKVKASTNKEQPQAAKREVGWTKIEGVLVPYLSRGSTQYVSVKMVETKMLSKYPSIDLDDMKDAGPIYSYYVTDEEAKILTEINTKCFKHAFGTDPFTEQDLIVSLVDFQKFYKNIRIHFENLEKEKHKAKEGGKEVKQKPAQEKQPSSQRRSRKQSNAGNWIQINNTVCPYIQRGDFKFVPVDVVKFGARLLLGKEYSAHKVAVTPLEIQVLNMLCKNAGLDFLFDVNTTKLIRLETVSQLMHPQIVQLRILSRKHPFEAGVYKKELEKSQNNGVSNGTQGITQPQALRTPSQPMQTQSQAMQITQAQPMQMTLSQPMQMTQSQPMLMTQSQAMQAMSRPMQMSQAQAMQMIQSQAMQAMRTSNQSLLTGGSSSVTQQQGVNVTSQDNKSALLQLRQMVTSHTQQRNLANQGGGLPPMSLPAPGVQSSQALQALPLTLPPSSMSMGMAPVQRPVPHQPILQPSQPIQPINIVPIVDHHLPGGPPPQLLQPMGSHSNYGVPSQQPMGSHGAPSQPPMGGGSHSSHSNHGILATATAGEPLIKPVRLSGKTVSCILRRSTGERYALVEALTRLYFPQCTLQEFQKALQTLLRIPLEELTPPEEQAFINFYDLPVRSLKCKTIAPILAFENYFQHLKFLFKDKTPASKTSTPAPAHPSFSAAASSSLSTPGPSQQPRGITTPTPSEGSRSSTPSEGSGPTKRPASADSLGAASKKPRLSQGAPQKKLGNVLAKLKERQEHQLNQN